MDRAADAPGVRRAGAGRGGHGDARVHGGAAWRRLDAGDSFPAPGVLLAASGAAFTAVVLGQLANAFACRSATRAAVAAGLVQQQAAGVGRAG